MPLCAVSYVSSTCVLLLPTSPSMRSCVTFVIDGSSSVPIRYCSTRCGGIGSRKNGWLLAVLSSLRVGSGVSLRGEPPSERCNRKASRLLCFADMVVHVVIPKGIRDRILGFVVL
jgi:hypothetical protein